jgi:putative ABC transport system substrate-binding protein
MGARAIARFRIIQVWPKDLPRRKSYGVKLGGLRLGEAWRPRCGRNRLLDMRRREFIRLLGAAAAWPVAAHAQRAEPMHRVGVLMNAQPDEPESQARIAAFVQGLQEAGWVVGRNVRIETRWAGGDNARLRQYASELVGLKLDVILSGTGGTVTPVQQASRTVPIVFAQAIDPVGAGNIETLARPNSNATGFLQFEYSLSAKWLELLREVAPSVKRVGVLRDSGAAAGIGQWAVIQAAAQPLGIELSSLDLFGAAEIERTMTAFGRVPNGGLIQVVSASGQIHRDLVVTLATRHRLPVVYPYRFFVASGGLISYGPDLVSQYRRAASYVDRILRGEKPADLPVQAPTKYELIVNLKTAKALGLTVPDTVLVRADEVIE